MVTVKHLCWSLFLIKLQALEEVARRCPVKKVFLKVSQNSQETPVLEFRVNNIAGL